VSKKHDILSKFYGDPQKKVLNRLNKKVGEINKLGDKYAKMSKKDLAAQTEILKKKLEKQLKTIEVSDKKAKKVVNNKKDAKPKKKSKKISDDKVQKALNAILPEALAVAGFGNHAAGCGVYFLAHCPRLCCGYPG